jgi:hypothetical protein
VGGQLHASGKEPVCTRWIGGGVLVWTQWSKVSCCCQELNPDRSAPSPSLYRGMLLLYATSPPSVSQLSRKSGSLDVSQPYGSPWPIAGIALPFFYLNKGNKRTHNEEVISGCLYVPFRKLLDAFLLNLVVTVYIGPFRSNKFDSCRISMILMLYKTETSELDFRF